ncbi:MAG: hypothetical protein KIH04_10535 [Candidatus Freyarchaeota archaeon]|nr:hypothetical protein [Candidatus Jordarchaeia archaeon]
MSFSGDREAVTSLISTSLREGSGVLRMKPMVGILFLRHRSRIRFTAAKYCSSHVV